MTYKSKGVNKLRKIELNTYIVTLFIFQFGILQPFTVLLNTQSPIAVFSLISIVLLLFNNKFYINIKVLIVLFCLFLFYLFNLLFYDVATQILASTFLVFLYKCVPGIVIGSIVIDENKIYSIFKKIAVINFVCLCIVLAIRNSFPIAYMRFGYAMIPSSLMFFYAIFVERKKIRWVLLFVFSLLFAITYGSRGVIVVFSMFFLFLLYANRSVSLYKKIICTIILVAGVYLIIYTDIVLDIIIYAYDQLGIKTYALAKIRMMFEQGIIASSSGRETIFKNALESIKANILLGNGISCWQSNVALSHEYSYPHNLILQILLESGLIGLFFWLFVWYKCAKNYIYAYKYADKRYHIILAIFISVSFGRLLVSSDIWQRSEYWITIIILLCTKLNHRQNLEYKQHIQELT